MTSLELTPHGIVVCRDPKLKEFAESDAAGLVALGGQKLQIETDLSVSYWKNFASGFLRELCHIPEGEAVEVPPPSSAELAELVLNAPPMRGAEYLSPEMLTNLWKRLEEWTKAQLPTLGSLATFLEKQAPLWS
ncbi:MAG: ATP-dependent helicase, partial [Verrucomicrobia bacterium]|nr:ATP-dependent helicase [Verrucomicrobiota bacterium]